MDEIKITSAKLIGLDRSFVTAFRSLFPDISVQVEQKPRDSFNLGRRVVSDLVYALKVMGVILLNIWTRTSHPPKATKRKFFSFFPSMFDDTGVETKYRTLIKDPEERDNIYEKEDPVSQAMLDKLYHFLGEEGEILDDTIYGKLNISPEAKDRLRELGYLM